MRAQIQSDADREVRTFDRYWPAQDRPQRQREGIAALMSADAIEPSPTHARACTFDEESALFEFPATLASPERAATYARALHTTI